MSISARIDRLERQPAARHGSGQILAAWMFDNPEDFERAKAQHVKDYPNHDGIRFIEYGTACIRHSYNDPEDIEEARP